MKRKWKNSSCLNGKNTRIYNIWLHMRNRCTFGSRSQETNKTYEGCSLYEDWYDYDIFHDWVVSNKYHTFKCRNDFYYQLDKDLIVKGNKIYSPETCEFIPREINSFLTKREKCRGDLPLGVYKFDDKFFRAMISDPFARTKSKHIGLYLNYVDAFNCYKQTKESYARRFCEIYKGKLSERTEIALTNYLVEITD